MLKFTQAKRLNRHLRQQKVFNNCLQLLSFINQQAIRATRQLASDSAIAALLLFIDYKASRKPSSQSNFISLLNIRFFSRFSDKTREGKHETSEGRPLLAPRLPSTNSSENVIFVDIPIYIKGTKILFYA